jgi:hypothetical protein
MVITQVCSSIRVFEEIQRKLYVEAFLENNTSIVWMISQVETHFGFNQR